MILENTINIPEAYIQGYIKDIDEIVLKKEWAKSKTAPRFQTDPFLFDRQDLHWQVLKNTFIELIFNITKRKIKFVTCWSYISLPDEWAYYDDKSWHNHLEDTEVKMSGIFYLKVPDGANGTEFRINNEVNLLNPKKNTWFMFDSKLEHRPSYWDHKNMKDSRYILAADAWLV